MLFQYPTNCYCYVICYLRLSLHFFPFRFRFRFVIYSSLSISVNMLLLYALLSFLFLSLVWQYLCLAHLLFLSRSILVSISFRCYFISDRTRDFSMRCYTITKHFACVLFSSLLPTTPSLYAPNTHSILFLIRNV